MSFTILGGSGFIGSRLAMELRASGEEVFAPGRDDGAYLSRELGHVIYCVGVTSDFHSRPLDTVDAHVAALMPLLRCGRFESLLYLSSTRVYRGCADGREDAILSLRVEASDDLYNTSKLMGEAICLASGRPSMRVVRLSNVYGEGMSRKTFLASILRDAVETGLMHLNTTPDSRKDYLSLDDLTPLLPRIAAAGRHRIYNVASGSNVTNGELAQRISHLTGCRIGIAANARSSVFPQISIDRAQREFGFAPARLEEHLPALVEFMRREMVAA
ncbi:MAG TPA: NAD(P)-dependent oxidoreductase [Alphaproteobacteria bacterium]|nr:NAD(P)-dependent oxidoreductase [Alphaproteobacteria bacterium]